MDVKRTGCSRLGRASVSVLHLGTRPAAISRRQRAISRTTPSLVHATAVHSRLRRPTIGRSLGSSRHLLSSTKIYREAVYIFYGKLSVYLKALERDAGQQWAMWVG